jgi:hypothetical protein
MRLFLLCGLGLVLGCSGGDSTAVDGGGDDGTASDGMPMNDTAVETGPVMCGTVICNKTETCINNTSCACGPGYVPNGTSGGCIAAPSGSPAAHTQADVCTHWKNGHVVTTPNPFTPGSTSCDPGTLAAGGITDTVVRINTFRWLVGLGSNVADDATLDTGDQDCAIIAVSNPAGLQAHNPPTSSTCYNSTGAAAAGMSNISWGVTSCDSIDLYVQDTGNETTLGHRRWIFHPPLGVVGVGWVVKGGTQFGRAGCLGVFDTSGTGPKPTWYAWPPPGFSPITADTKTEWSFHYPAGMTTATATVTDMATNMPLSVTTTMLPKYYGDDAFEITPSGWMPTAGDVYRVTVTPDNAAPIVYDVSPVMCP